MRSTNKRSKESSHRPIVKNQKIKRVVFSFLLATVGLVAYGYAYQYTHQAKLEKQYHQVQQEIEAKNKSLLQSSSDKQQLQKQLEDLQKQLQAKKDSQARALAEAAPVVRTAYPVPSGDAKAFIYSHESGNNPASINRSSGACGLGQALPCSKMPCSLQDYACQDNFFTGYMISRYGTWENARAFWIAHRWW